MRMMTQRGLLIVQVVLLLTTTTKAFRGGSSTVLLDIRGGDTSSDFLNTGDAPYFTEQETFQDRIDDWKTAQQVSQDSTFSQLPASYFTCRYIT